MINILHNQFSIDEDWCFGTFSKFIRPGSKVTIIPFSFRDSQIVEAAQWDDFYGRDHGIYYHGMVEALARYEIDEAQIEWVNYFNDTPEMARQKIVHADILYFPGGLPDRTYERIVEFGLTDAIRAHAGIVMGFSAGAMIQLDEYHISPDDDYPEYCYGKGCGLITDFGIEVHYENSDIQNECINRFIRERHKPVYAMADDGALIVESGNILTIGKVSHFPVQ